MFLSQVALTAGGVSHSLQFDSLAMVLLQCGPNAAGVIDMLV